MHLDYLDPQARLDLLDPLESVVSVVLLGHQVLLALQV